MKTPGLGKCRCFLILSGGQIKSVEAYLADSSLPSDLRPLYEAKKKKTGRLQLSFFPSQMGIDLNH